MRPVNIRTLPTLGVGLALAATFAGCGGSKLSGSSIEKLIAQDLGNRGYSSVKVQCDDVDNEVGKKFTCDVEGGPGFTKIDGSVAKGDQINIDRVR
jgi:hypothetical protein